MCKLEQRNPIIGGRTAKNSQMESMRISLNGNKQT
jgi:hypothetical protein